MIPRLLLPTCLLSTLRLPVTLTAISYFGCKTRVLADEMENALSGADPERPSRAGGGTDFGFCYLGTPMQNCTTIVVGEHVKEDDMLGRDFPGVQVPEELGRVVRRIYAPSFQFDQEELA